MAELLLSKVRYGATDPEAFLNLRALFGHDLPQSSPFVEGVRKTLASLYQKGARATLATFLTQRAL